MAGKSVRRSLAISFANRYSGMIITVVSVMIVSRLLTPSQIGLFSVCVAFVGLAHIVRDLGVGQYLVVERELTSDRIRTAFGIAILSAWALAALLFGLRFAVAGFYDEPAMSGVLAVLSINFVLLPFGSPVLALLHREMEFGKLFAVNIVSTIIRETTTVGLALSGYGFMSLAWGAVAGVLATVVLATLQRPKSALILPNLREWRRVLSIGGRLSAVMVVIEVGISVQEMIVGRMLGFTSVAMYSRARGALAQFDRVVTGAVRAVVMPSFAEMHRNDRNLKPALLLAISHITALGWPFFAFVAIMGFPITRIMFGDQWDAAVPILRILAGGVAAISAATFCNPALVTLGRADLVLRIEGTAQALRILGVLLGALHSLTLVAVAYTSVTILTMVLYFAAVAPAIGATARDFIAVLAKTAAITACSSAVPLVLLLTVGVDPAVMVPTLIAATLGCGVGWLFGVWATGHPILEEFATLLAQARQTLGLRRTAKRAVDEEVA